MFKRNALFALMITLLTSLHARAAEGDTMNFRFSPVEVLISTLHVNMDFVIAPNWTLGPELTLSHYTRDADGFASTKYTVNVFGGGARANWFKNGTYATGLYVGPFTNIQQIKVKAEDSSGAAEATATVPVIGSLVGYAWFWKSFNMMLGGGLSFPLGTPKIKVKSSNGSEDSVNYSRFSGLAFEYSLGWTF